VYTTRKHEIENFSPKSLTKESNMERELVMTIESIFQLEILRWYVILTCHLK
jgi:hypothetical protein